MNTYIITYQHHTEALFAFTSFGTDFWLSPLAYLPLVSQLILYVPINHLLFNHLLFTI
jgi:hypothetical protein